MEMGISVFYGAEPTGDGVFSSYNWLWFALCTFKWEVVFYVLFDHGLINPLKRGLERYCYAMHL